MKINSNRGSVVLSAVILGTVMAVAAASYIALAMGTYKRANRSFYYNSAVNIAETGAEDAMWALNADNGKGDWNKTLLTGAVWSGTMDKTLLGSSSSSKVTDSNRAQGYYNIFVKGAQDASGDPGTDPIITVESVLQLATAAPVRKQIRIETSLAEFDDAGFAALRKAKVGGSLDSFSRDDGDYLTASSQPNITVASPSVIFGDASIGATADIYGHLAVGFSSDLSEAFIKTIKGSLTNDTTKYPSDGVEKQGSNLIDTNLISYDFEADYPVRDAPTGGINLVPLLVPDGNGIITIGDPSATTPTVYYVTGDLTIPNPQNLLIVGPVEIVVSGTITVGGLASINVLESSFSMTTGTFTKTYTGSTAAAGDIYGYGNISISGNGSVVPVSATGADANNLRIFGTNPTPGVQQIAIGGNGNLCGILYAPSALITFNGGGSGGIFAGSVVGLDITVNGSNYNIRHQENPENYTGVYSYDVSKWSELTNPSDWHSF